MGHKTSVLVTVFIRELVACQGFQHYIHNLVSTLHRCFTFHLLGLLRGSGSAEVVKVNIEPVVDVFVQCVILVTYLLRCQPLLYSLQPATPIIIIIV